MCTICHGTGTHYDYTNSTVMVMPCPDDTCRAMAQERSKKAIQRIKAEIKKQKVNSHQEAN